MARFGKSRFDIEYEKLKAAAAKWGVPIANPVVVNNKMLDTDINYLIEKATEIKNKSGWPGSINIKTVTAGQTNINPDNIQLGEIGNVATQMKAHCPCNCNNCRCDCNDCFCNCDRCNCDNRMSGG